MDVRLTKIAKDLKMAYFHEICFRECLWDMLFAMVHGSGPDNGVFLGGCSTHKQQLLSVRCGVEGGEVLEFWSSLVTARWGRLSARAVWGQSPNLSRL